MVLAFALCNAGAALWAQDAAGKITGTVTDATGAVVTGAKVTVTHTGTRIGRKTVTDASGSYQAAPLPIGLYEVAAEAPGFSRTVVTGKNPLEINQTLRIDITLEIGNVKDTLTVEGGATSVETENATVGTTVDGSSIYELPLNGRNTLDLLATQPGAMPKNNDAARQAGSYSIGGMRSDSVTYLLDGGNNNHLINNDVVINPNPDAVAEFRVLESNYSAEYGRNAGGVVSVVTKSGTNALHGTGFDFIRNEDFDANTFFNNQQGVDRQILKRNQFGATLGGPVMLPHIVDGRNKLFFFFSYEGQKQNANVQSTKVTTYTPLEAQGNFSQSVNGGPDPTVVSFLQNNPYYQPSPTLAAQGIIAATSISSVAQNYFKQGLIPTSATGYLFPQATAKADHSEYMGKMDYTFGTKDTISGTFAAQDSPSTVPFSGSQGATTVNGYPVANDMTAYFGNVAYNHTFSATLLNQMRVTAQRNNTHQNFPLGTKPGAADLGVGLTPDLSDGPPIINLMGSGLFAGYNPYGPANIVDNTYTFTDDLSATRGKHSLKAGFYFSAYRDAMAYGYYVNGEFDFAGPGTLIGSGNDRADFLFGLPDDLQQYPNAPTNIRSHSFAGYAQDSWKVTRNFTLNYGVRYEYNQPKYDTQGRSFSFIRGHGLPRRSAGASVPRRQGCAEWSKLPRQERLCAARGLRLGRVRQRQDLTPRRRGHVLRRLEGRGQPPVQRPGAVLRGGLPDLQSAGRRLHVRPGHPDESLRGGGRGESGPLQAGQPQRELRHGGRPTDRRRQFGLRQSASEDAVYLPIQSEPAAGTGAQPDARSGLRRLLGARADRVDGQQPVRAGLEHANPGRAGVLRGRLQLHEHLRQPGQGQLQCAADERDQAAVKRAFRRDVLQVRLHLVARVGQRFGLPSAQRLCALFQPLAVPLLGRLRLAQCGFVLRRLGTALRQALGESAQDSDQGLEPVSDRQLPLGLPPGCPGRPVHRHELPGPLGRG
jgi:outer membrane receptor protein involved in Fe transport